MTRAVRNTVAGRLLALMSFSFTSILEPSIHINHVLFRYMDVTELRD